VQVLRARAPAQQVHAAPPQLAGTRPGQEETNPPRLDQAVDFVQKAGEPLHLVDDDLPRLRTCLLAKPVGIGEQPAIVSTVQEVVEDHGRQGSGSGILDEGLSNQRPDTDPGAGSRRPLSVISSSSRGDGEWYSFYIP